MPISFYTDKIKVNGIAYPKTTGLLELLIAKQPNENNLKPDDLKNYCKILKLSSANKKKYDKNERIRAHNSNKFNNIIAPMFKGRGYRRGLLLYFSGNFFLFKYIQICSKTSPKPPLLVQY